MSVSVLGVRHHGPGSARALRAELERLKPDVVLIEGPPEADELVALAQDPDLQPPVALLAHVPGEPSRAAFWPFAVFSPEWQAIRYAVGAGVPVRFCDLPAAHGLAVPAEDSEEAGSPGDAAGDGDAGPAPAGDDPAEEERARAVRIDPIGELARAAGYDDPERWWEDAVEHRGDTPFQVIAEAMAAVREGHVPDGYEARREAFMRRTVRKAVKDGFERVAVVCGAWHVPALADPADPAGSGGDGGPAGRGRRGWGAGLPPAKADDALLKGLPKAKVELTWVPWTYGRLAAWSGYGAGVTSPGWYHHLFASPDRPVERWLTEAAGVLRAEDLPVSSAHVIEAVRLAESLAVLRGRPLAGLAEVTEAVRAVLCEGDDLPVELIQRHMVVGERLGQVPDTTPMVPLQRHLREEQRRLKLKPEALDRELDLDLRKPLDLERSRLLHRLRLLGVDWGSPQESRGKGTFRESWTLAWRPEFDIDLIEAGAWGTTVPSAAAARVRDLARGGTAGRGRSGAPGRGVPAPGTAGAGGSAGSGGGVSLADLTGLVERCLLADLPDALPYVLEALSARAALDSDVTHLMAALPAMVRAQRYGDVRGTPAAGLASIVDALLTRVCVGLGGAVTGLDDDAARGLLGHVDAVHAAVGLLDSAGDEPPKGRWLGALRAVSGRSDLHGLIEGRIVRILLDTGELDAGRAELRMSRAMSSGHPPARAAAWVEGFVSGGGLLLVHDARLLGLIDGWLTGLTPEAFVDVLPLLRRTFGAFAAPERRAIGERARSLGTGATTAAAAADDIDDQRAAAAVRTVLEILGRAS
ncbi:DUF5682 family protein [Planomonospora venezuelensis]|uniref:Uncharacterized protein n=1 Tax=Planomonospora venezuelensis TaxID=1999 RepID=A0A841DC72_PLAVE|nr:DUF5682 family protein [Planomonospora venezuelensis]MBB5964956.1 hypothetical protein [Planomonospora venezuelensis]GIN03291.1 hypothetical protein Pve01_49490 [Planomonospora venezuelensis]